MSAFTHVSIDGDEQDPSSASIPVSDIGFIRGYGVFEVVRAIDGVCFRLDPHLERLARSAGMLGIGLPPLDRIGGWAADAARAAGSDDGLVRILVSSGDDPYEGTARIVVTGEATPDQPDSITLLPVYAPWHSDGEKWELLRAKTLSYANNFAARREALVAGHTDALLIGRSGRVLEGPTFAVGWVVEEQERRVYETPAMSLGILDSITRQLAFDAAEEAGLEFREVATDIGRLGDASEFFAMSTLRDAVTVTAVGERRFEKTDATTDLRDAMARLTARELAVAR